MVVKSATKPCDGSKSVSGFNEDRGEEPGEVKDKQAPCIGVIGVDYSVEQYLEQRGIKFKRVEGGALTRCLFCRSRSQKLRLSSDVGSFECSACGKTGAFAAFRKQIGDLPVASVGAPVELQFEVLVPEFKPIGYSVDYTRRMNKSSKASAFLQEYGVTKELAERLKLGLTKTDAVTWPFMFTRKRASVSYITLFDGKHAWVKLDGDPKLCSWFGQHLFKSGNDVAFVCQTPLDAAVLMAVGESNVIAPPQDNELPRLRAHQVALLEKCSLVYLVPNPTYEGQQWALRLQGEVGRPDTGRLG